MARKRASMREGPLAELFRATEAAQRQSDTRPPEEEDESTPGPEYEGESTPEPEPALQPRAR